MQRSSARSPSLQLKHTTNINIRKHIQHFYCFCALLVYWHIKDKISKLHAEDISKTEAKQILKQNNIIVKSLPGHGNMGLKRKEIMAYGNKECSIKIRE